MYTVCMSSIKTLKYATGVLIGIALLHICGVFFYLYWHFWWYDIVLHFLGGLWVALMALYFIGEGRSIFNQFLIAIFTAFLVGVGLGSF